MFKQKSSLYLSMATILFAFVLLTLTGCDSKSTSDSASAGTTVSITSSRTTLNLSDAKTAFIVVTVLDGGTGVVDQDVSFSVNPTNAGTFTVTDTATDANGEALTMFTASSTGTATITASINNGAYTRTINLTVSTSSSGSNGSLDISITPSLLVATGMDTARVDIAVVDGSGNPAADSTLVKITAGEKFVDIDSNGYWSEGIDSLVFDANGNEHWDGFGIIPSVAYTSGGTGTVSVNYISGSEALTVYIKVTVDDNGIFTTDEATLQVTPDALLYSIFMASDSMQLSVKHTGGIETGMLRATAYDVNGNPMPEGVPITFFITDGPGGGEHLATVEPDSTYQTLTNSQGIASCPIHSGTISGTIRVRAYNDTVISNATQVLVSAGPPAYIVVGSEGCNVDFWDEVGEENQIVAVVSDAFLNPVNDSTVVYFSCDEGTMKSHEERTVDHEGIATTLWFSGNNVDSADGRVYIMAETSGGTVADTSMFYNSHLCDTLICYGMPASMDADGKSEVVVMVEGYDFNGNPVINATTFDADATYLTVAGGTLEDGCYSARARVKITSAVLDQDQSLTGGNDDGIGATDYVQYWKHAAYSVFACDLLTGNAYSGNSLIDGQTNASPGETIFFSVIVKDRAGNPLGDHTINLSATVGAVTPNTGETNGYGEAGPFTWTAPAGIGDYTITANDVDPRGGIVMLLNVKVE
ncbi:MAG: hypothetical protein JXA92_02350 [candidate division Zixibacteria bacterium]|nr:hypothetical protein [candidate division Zixibacteria bacterium]